MAGLLPQLTSFPPRKEMTEQEYDIKATEYLKRLNTLDQKAWKQVDDEDLMAKLDPAVYSIIHLKWLVQHILAHGNDRTRATTIAAQALKYFQQFDPIQVRYVGKDWKEVYAWTIEACRSLGERDLSPLAQALIRLDTGASFWTPNHTAFVRLCMDSALPSQALPILLIDWYNVPSNVHKHTVDEPLSTPDASAALNNIRSGLFRAANAEDMMEYYLLGAHVFIAHQNWSRARSFLELVILHPSTNHAISALQTEAYKKWILIGLLSNGALFPHLRTSDGQVMKHIKSIAKPYEVLAGTFEKREWSKLRAEIESGHTIWADDGNHRLVAAVGEAVVTYSVQDLEKTYTALPMQRVADHVGMTLPKTLKTVTDMIQQHRLDANLDASGTTLRFDAPQRSSAIRIEAHTQRIEKLVQAVRDADRRLQVTKEHAEVLRRSTKQGGGIDMAGEMDLEFSNAGPAVIPEDTYDEELMA